MINHTMKSKMNNRTYAVLASVAFTLLAGCATQKTMYGWKDYQPQVYKYFKGSDADGQIIVLEKNLEEFKARNEPAPPGFHAYLGMLYAQTGNIDRTTQEFGEEKTLFPESAFYMDFLLNKKVSGMSNETNNKSSEPAQQP